MIVDTIPRNDTNIILLSNLRSIDGGFAVSLFETYIDGGGASFSDGDYYFILDGGFASDIGGNALTTFYDGILDGGNA